MKVLRNGVLEGYKTVFQFLHLGLDASYLLYLGQKLHAFFKLRFYSAQFPVGLGRHGLDVLLKLVHLAPELSQILVFYKVFRVGLQLFHPAFQITEIPQRLYVFDFLFKDIYLGAPLLFYCIELLSHISHGLRLAYILCYQIWYAIYNSLKLGQLPRKLVQCLLRRIYPVYIGINISNRIANFFFHVCYSRYNFGFYTFRHKTLHAVHSCLEIFQLGR